MTKINGAFLDCWPFFPFPHFLDERLTAYVMPRLPFLLPQFLLHHNLSGDSCVVTAREPQSLVTSHSMPKQKSFKSMIRHTYFVLLKFNLKKLIYRIFANRWFKLFWEIQVIIPSKKVIKLNRKKNFGGYLSSTNLHPHQMIFFYCYS